MRGSACTWRRQPGQLQRPLTASGTTTSGNGICERSAHASLRSTAPRRPTGRATANTNLCTMQQLLAWATTMLPTINQSVRDACTQINTGHQDIRSYSQATLATADDTAAAPPVTSQARTHAPLSDICQRFQSARTRMATISSDIRQYFPGIDDGAT
jgi:hypothetical protein